jgi:uncharacterized protein (TIGR00255 family)
MLLSMTGFGRADVETDEVAVSAEVTGLNGRYLDIIVKLPPESAALEIGLKRLVRDKVGRGRVSVSVSAQRLGTHAARVTLDEDAAEQYVASSLALAKRLGLKNDLTLTSILNLPEVARAEEQREPDEKERAAIEKAVLLALDEFESMRRAEGEALERDLRERVETVRSALAEVEQRLPELNREYMARLRQKMADIAADLSVKEERIAMEVAVMAEKADVTEEAVRLKSHLDQFVGLIEGDGSIGRKLEFLVQEMNREANTIGAKNRDSTVIGQVLEIKSQLEKIREQVQNIE